MLTHLSPVFQDRALRFWATIGDIKSDRVIVQPVVVPNLVPGKVETFTMQFQAPQGAGLYTFQAAFVGNAVADGEVWKGMQVSSRFRLVSAFFSHFPCRLPPSSFPLPSLNLKLTPSPVYFPPLPAFQLQVSDPALSASELSEDEISDPEEDTIEGQLAQLKGGKVKRSSKTTGNDDSESESESEESSSDEDGPKKGGKKGEDNSSSDESDD